VSSQNDLSLSGMSWILDWKVEEFNVEESKEPTELNVQLSALQDFQSEIRNPTVGDPNLLVPAASKVHAGFSILDGKSRKSQHCDFSSVDFSTSSGGTKLILADKRIK
jgi:hypothetical protein